MTAGFGPPRRTIELRDAWVIWSHEHKRWWAPDERGYSDSILGAGVYSLEDAKRIVDAAEPGNESTVPLRDGIALAEMRRNAQVAPGSIADAILREITPPL